MLLTHAVSRLRRQSHLSPSLAGLLATVLLLGPAPAALAAKTSSAGKADRTIPTIAITAPTAGATVGAKLSVTGTAADNVALARVEVSVDGGAWKSATGTSSWTAQIDTALYPNGLHTITARATDTAALSASRTVTVDVRNAAADTTAPTIAISSPTAGATVGHQIAVSGSAADDAAVAKVEVALDGGAWQPAGGTTSWSATLSAASAADGQHVVAARATDASGNTSSATVAIVVAGQAVPAPAMSPGTIGGFVFQEQDRDGVLQAGEQPLAGAYVYLFDALGTYVANTATDATGWYAFSGLAAGSYRVAIAPISWNALRNDWVADTTGTIFPEATVSLASTARQDLGTRPILRSTSASSPISSYTGANGLTVKSYDDAVAAREVYDRLTSGSLVGSEARYVTVRFDFAQSGLTSSLATQSNGVYVDYRATSDVTWAGWLRGDGELFHEYGHAWSMYYADMVQGDPTLRAYLQARGLYGDPRIGSSYAWDPNEMIAEDYRELFGTAGARADSQINAAIPLARDVPGLASFLSGAFMQTRVP